MKSSTKICLLVIFILLLTVFVPIIINYCYSCNHTIFITQWGAKEMLSYYGTILTFLGTTILGAIAIKQSEQANKISKKLLDLENDKTIPVVDLKDANIPFSKLPSNTLSHSLQISGSDDSCFHIGNNSVPSFNDDFPIYAFIIKNISSAYISEIKIKNIEYTESINDGKKKFKSFKIIQYNKTSFLESNEEEFFLISLPEPKINITKEETDSLPIIKINFSIKNYIGETYYENIKLSYFATEKEYDIYKPKIFTKQISTPKKIDLE